MIRNECLLESKQADEEFYYSRLKMYLQSTVTKPSIGVFGCMLQPLQRSHTAACSDTNYCVIWLCHS
ncbi:hypothetical protein DAI22_02g009300 [Oryza sativa Japonica Group]|nr:hypothetical protein DAI22_02g009300 [Oryza sativa Japonica Group]